MNAKVRDYDLRDFDNEINRSLKFYLIKWLEFSTT